MSAFVARRILGLSMVAQGVVVAFTPFKPKWQLKAARRLARAKGCEKGSSDE